MLSVVNKLLLMFVCVGALLAASCGEEASRSNDSSTGSDIRSYLQKPGQITHIRYTTVTPPWPTRTEAWIDWENNQIRSWNVQWTDSATNPSICTSIENEDAWFPCLPSRTEFGPEADFARAFWPKIPLRTTESELSITLPNYDFSESDQTPTAPEPVRLETDSTVKEKGEGDAKVVVTSWPLSSTIPYPCNDNKPGSAHFEYTSSAASGEPLSEYIVLECEDGEFPITGAVYHNVEFVDRSSLPEDFFDVDSASEALIEEQLSSAAAQLGSVFWLGDEVGDWKLAGAEHDASDASVYYSRGSGDDEEMMELRSRTPGFGYLCEEPEPITTGAYEGSLCTVDDIDLTYRILWRPEGFDVILEKSSYPETISRDEILLLAAGLDEWGHKATDPLLTADRVRDFVSDSLELVCPSGRKRILEARSQPSDFSFDRASGEWLGSFGEFGEFAVPDSRPVAIPVSQRENAETTLSHNAAQFAECTADEAPEPQEGDDVFGLTHDGQNDEGFSFTITGLDSEADAALTFCLVAPDDGCALRDPEGSVVEFRGIDIDAVRSQVVEILIPVDPERMAMEGTWTFDLDLGEGRTASTSFEVQ